MLDYEASAGMSGETPKKWDAAEKARQAPRQRSAGPLDSILLIEDDDHVAEAITYLLEGERYFVFRASDALEALEQLRSGLVPDVILLDLRMPRMDGWEFRVAQRREPMLSAIPIIALSADDSAKARAIDAEVFLKKPVDGTVLLDAIRSTRDEFERRRCGARAAQEKRLGSVGGIAAGIAHEINNPLATVMSNLELATRRCTRLFHEQDDPQREALVSIMKHLADAQAGNARIAEVVRNVATFARPDTEEIAPVDVQSVLDSTIRLLASEIRHRGHLERVYAHVPKVLGNATTLAQLFLNVLIHAIHALGDAPRGGVLRVELESRGKHVQISIGDSWPNLAPEVAERLLDPFFSSRMRSLGLGLGLAISQRSILAMGGALRLESDPVRGTVFHIALPAHLPHEGGAHTTARIAEPERVLPHGL